MLNTQDAALPDAGQRDGDAVAGGVPEHAGVRPGQPEELLDGHRCDIDPVRVRTDGHLHGGAREHQDAAGDAPAPAPGRVREPVARRPGHGRGRVLRRVRGGRGVGAQAVAAAVLRRGHHAAQAAGAGAGPEQAAQLHADGGGGRDGGRGPGGSGGGRGGSAQPAAAGDGRRWRSWRPRPRGRRRRLGRLVPVAPAAAAAVAAARAARHPPVTRVETV